MSRAARIKARLYAARLEAVVARMAASDALVDAIMSRAGTTGAARLAAALRIDRAEAVAAVADARLASVEGWLRRVERIEARRLEAEMASNFVLAVA